jgi:predicted MFS family arabinose efflux permease
MAWQGAGMRAYAQLLRTPGVRGPLLASTLGRLPIGAAALAVIFLVRSETGSFASAGAANAAMGLGVAVGLPLLARVVDRVGQTSVLVLSAAANAAALAALVIVADGGASLGALCALAALGGVTLPPLGLCMRALWRPLVGGDETLQTAYALDAVIIEVAFVAGPLLAAGLTVAVAPSAAVIACAVLSFGGSWAFALTPASRRWRPVDARRHWAGPLLSRGLWVLIGTSLCFGFAQGTLELTLTAFGSAHGSQAIAGPMIAVQSAASLVGGLVYGARPRTAPAEQRYARLSVLLAVGFAPLALADSVGVLAVLMIMPGLALAAVTSVEYLIVDRVVPEGTSTEAFGWMITAALVGVSLGAAAGGAAVNGGHIRAGFLVAFAGVALAALGAIAGRGRLRPA